MAEKHRHDSDDDHDCRWPDIKALLATDVPIHELVFQCASCDRDIETRRQRIDAVVRFCGHVFHERCLSAAREESILNGEEPACGLCRQSDVYKNCRCLIPAKPLPTTRASAIVLPLTRPEGGAVHTYCIEHLLRNAFINLLTQAWNHPDFHTGEIIEAPVLAVTDGIRMCFSSPDGFCFGEGTFASCGVMEWTEMRAKCAQESEEIGWFMNRTWGDYGRLEWPPRFKVGWHGPKRSGPCICCEDPNCRNSADYKRPPGS